MIYNVNDIVVEIDGQLFPAANIQVFECYPEFHWDKDHKTFYGVYFEVMFENGANACVTQELCDVANGNASTVCTELDHFIVEITRMQNRYKEIEFAHHCTSEANLAKVLQQEIERHKFPTGTIWYSSRSLAIMADEMVA